MQCMIWTALCDSLERLRVRKNTDSLSFIFSSVKWASGFFDFYSGYTYNKMGEFMGKQFLKSWQF